MSWFTDLFFRDQDQETIAALRQQLVRQMKTITDLNNALAAAKSRADALAETNTGLAANNATLSTASAQKDATISAQDATIADLRAQLSAASAEDFTPQVEVADSIAAAPAPAA